MYNNLLSQGKIGRLTLKNRLIMPGMSDHFSNETGDFIDVCKAYYEERAKGGTALIITSFCYVDKTGQAETCQLRCYEESHLSGLKRLSDGVHYYDGKIFLQLHHAGRGTSSEITGTQPIAPSAIPAVIDLGEDTFEMEMPRAMTKEDIDYIVGRFINSAVLAKRAGFDGVELHAAHGYLLCQFFSPASNIRDDEYGGNTENRTRIAKEIITGIKQACGRIFPISVRISGIDGAENGIDVCEAVKIAKCLESYGADLINVSGGGDADNKSIIAPSDVPKNFLVYIAEAIKREVSIPVAVVGKIRDFDFADNAIADKKTDFICMGRPHIADPYIIKKLKSGREDEIRKCLTCMSCLDSTARLTCSVNPVVGNEQDFKSFKTNGNGRKIAVIGGGPAGCEAARVLALRGFDVTLIERSDRLGGQVKLAALPNHKEDMLNIVNYYTTVLPRAGVNVLYNTEATSNIIDKLSPIAVFVATGSRPIVPAVKGIENKNVMTAEYALLNHENIKNSKVVVVGSGNTGIETAELLYSLGNDITIADMLAKIGQLAGTSGMYVLMDLAKKGINRMPNCRLERIEDKKVYFTNIETCEEVSVDFDYLVYSLGVCSDNDTAKILQKPGRHIETIGDANRTGKIQTSVSDGFYKAFFFDADFTEMV